MPFIQSTATETLFQATGGGMDNSQAGLDAVVRIVNVHGLLHFFNAAS
jgi:hypothetical protein